MKVYLLTSCGKNYSPDPDDALDMGDGVCKSGIGAKRLAQEHCDEIEEIKNVLTWTANRDNTGWDAESNTCLYRIRLMGVEP